MVRTTTKLRGWRGSRFVLMAALLVAATAVGAQTPPRVGLRQAELEVWSRLEQRARRLGALMLDSSEMDLRYPIQGEAEEVIGVTRLTNSSLAVVTARLEPLEALASPQVPFHAGRYDLRIEDRAGNCILVHQVVAVDTGLVRQQRSTEPCRPVYMADVVRRGRRVARIPLNAGQLSDSWSVAPAVIAFADVYRDSVVVLTASLALRANLRPGDSVKVDSISVGLARGENSWSIVRHSAAVVIDSVLRSGDTWVHKHLRFMIPLDSSDTLSESWPVLQVTLGVAPTDANPYGRSWTYAHGARSFFAPVARLTQGPNARVAPPPGR